MRIEHHPKLNIWVREDGCVYLPQNYRFAAHWTFGCPNSRGYRRVKVDGKHYYVHRLVVEAFIQYPIPEGMEVDHKNRVRDDNRLENIRIVTPSQNNRNTSANDRIDARNGIHIYEDERQYMREHRARYHQAKRKTHRLVHFADGRQRWILHEEAEALLAIPLKERIFKG